MQHVVRVAGESKHMRAHGLMGGIAHAECLPARQRGLVPVAHGIAAEGVSQGLAARPFECRSQVRVRSL
jgi:hypothetical protein